MSEAVRTAVPVKRLALVAVIIAVVTALDQLSKAWAREALAEKSMTFIPGLLDFRLTFNTGAAFSLGQGKGIIFAAVAAAVVVFIFILVWREPTMPLPLVISLACVAGGGLGNLIDRVAEGQVTDFIATTFINFPVFNVADSFVTVGVILTIVFLLTFGERPEA